jgi:hypothetical protein
LAVKLQAHPGGELATIEPGSCAVCASPHETAKRRLALKSSKLNRKLPGGPARRSSRSRAESAEAKSAGIKEIAATVGVSIGTVDRALHARPGISEATRARILKAAAALGYRPNLAARHLKLGRQRRISVHLPQEIASYFDAMRQGIQQAAAQLQPPLKVDFHSYPRSGLADQRGDSGGSARRENEAIAGTIEYGLE